MTITAHAKKRLSERLGTKDLTIAKKAWDSSEQLPDWFKSNLSSIGFKTFTYKSLHSNVFVFSVDKSKIKLITIYKNETRRSPQREGFLAGIRQRKKNKKLPRLRHIGMR